MHTLGQNKFNDFVDLLIYAEESGINTSKMIDLIKINYFDIFGHNKKLLLFYEEFTKGKSRYCKTHSDKTKEKRIEELRTFFASIPNERISVYEQLGYENEILGYVQATYPIEKRYVFVKSLETKYAPRAECYCLNNGKTSSLKIQRKIYDNNMFGGGEILYIKNFQEKPAVKFIDGKYVEDEIQTAWWISNYSIIPPNEFDKIVSNTLDK
jgi:DNA polymerase III alpha subunit